MKAQLVLTKIQRQKLTLFTVFTFFVGTFHDFYLACGTAIISKKNWYVILCQHGDVLGHHVISMEVFYERCGKT